MKKLLSIVLAIAMVFTFMVPAFAEGTTVVYYVGDTQYGDAVAANVGEIYTPDRMPTAENTPAGKYFAGWKYNGNYVLNGITVAEGENKLEASFVDYPVEEKAYLSVEGLQNAENGTPIISAPFTYTKYETFEDYIAEPKVSTATNQMYLNSEFNGGYIRREYVTEGEGAPYIKYGTNSSGTHAAAQFLYDENGVAYAGKWNTTYTIKVKAVFPQLNGRNFYIAPMFGVRKENMYGTDPNYADYAKESYNPCANRGDQVAWLAARMAYSYTIDGVSPNGKDTGWTYDCQGNPGSIYKLTPDSSTGYTVVEAGEEVHELVFTLSTGNANASFAPYFSLRVSSDDDKDRSDWENTIEIREVTIIDTSAAKVNYINGNETIKTDNNLVAGSQYTIDEAIANTNTHYFAGWFFDKEFTQPVRSTFALPAGEVNLYAKFVEYKDSATLKAIPSTDLKTNNPIGGLLAYKHLIATNSGWFDITQYPTNPNLDQAYGYYSMVDGKYTDLLSAGGYNHQGFYPKSSETGYIFGGWDSSDNPSNQSNYSRASTWVIGDGSGDAFVVEPNTTYKVSVSYYRTECTVSNHELLTGSLSVGTGLSTSYLRSSGDHLLWDLGERAYFGFGQTESAKRFDTLKDAAPKWRTSDVVALDGGDGEQATKDFYITTPSLEEYQANNMAQVLVTYASYNGWLYFTNIEIEKVVAKVQYIVEGDVEATIDDLEVGSAYAPDRMPKAKTPAGKYFAGWSYNDKLVVDTVTLAAGNNTLTAVYKDYVTGSVNASLSIPSDNVLAYPTVVDGIYKGNIPYKGYAPAEYVNAGTDSYMKHYNAAAWNQSTLIPIHDADGVPYVGKTGTTYAITFTYRVPVNARSQLSTNYDSNDKNTRASFYMYVNTAFKPAMLVSADGKTDYLRNWYASDNGHNDWRFMATNDKTISYDHGDGFPFWPDVNATEWTTETFYVTTPNQEYYDSTGAVPMFTYMISAPGNSTGKVELNINAITITELSIQDDLKTATIADKEVGYYKLLDQVDDNATYKVTFSGNLKESGNSSVYGLTANADNINLNQSLIYGYNADEQDVHVAMGSFGDGSMRTHTSFITVDLAAQEGEALYIYVTNPDLLNQLNLISVEKVDAVANGGVSMLKDADEGDTQALRYYFSYTSNTGRDIIIDGETYEIASRGFLLADANEIGDKVVTLATAAEEDSGIINKNITDLTKCWSYEANGEETYKVEFSTYITGFVPREGTYNNTEKLYVKAYVVLSNGSVVYTNESTDTVADVYNLVLAGQGRVHDNT